MFPVSSSGQNDGGDFLKNQFQNANISPEMLNYGLSAGQEILNRQKAKWMPGASDLWSSLKIYFAVSNGYVVKKISTVLYPMRRETWARIPIDEAEAEV